MLAARCGEALELPPADESAVVYTTLLRFLGYTSDASATAMLAGVDEIEVNAVLAPVVMADDRQALPHLLRHLGEDLPLGRRVGRIAAALSDPGGKSRSLSSDCEVGAPAWPLVSGSPLRWCSGWLTPRSVGTARGSPAGSTGDDIPLATRIAVVARDVDVTARTSGTDNVARILRRDRRGRAHDLAVVDAFLADVDGWLEELERVDPWDAVVNAEPAPLGYTDWFNHRGFTAGSPPTTATSPQPSSRPPSVVGPPRLPSRSANDLSSHETRGGSGSPGGGERSSR